LAATDYFQEPLKGASYHWLLKNGDAWQVEGKGKLDKSGASGFSQVLPDGISEQGLNLLLTVVHRKISEKLHVRVPVRSEDLRVSFFPEGGAWVAGMPGTLMIKAYDA